MSLLFPAGDWSKVPSDAPRFVIDMFPCNIAPNTFINSIPQSIDKPFGKPKDGGKSIKFKFRLFGWKNFSQIFIVIDDTAFTKHCGIERE